MASIRVNLSKMDVPWLQTPPDKSRLWTSNKKISSEDRKSFRKIATHKSDTKTRYPWELTSFTWFKLSLKIYIDSLLLRSRKSLTLSRNNISATIFYEVLLFLVNLQHQVFCLWTDLCRFYPHILETNGGLKISIVKFLSIVKILLKRAKYKHIVSLRCYEIVIPLIKVSTNYTKEKIIHF